MINSLFTTVAEELNQYFSNRFSLQEDKVIVSALPDNNAQGGGVSNEDNLILTLANIEQERISNKPSIGGVNSPVNLYVYMLFSAGFSENNYGEALKLLSAVISFFQHKKVFNQQNTPALHNSIDKLSFDMINMNIQELNQIWSVHGGKYLPSVIYRARIVTIEEDNLIEDNFKMAGFGTGMFKK